MVALKWPYTQICCNVLKVVFYVGEGSKYGPSERETIVG